MQVIDAQEELNSEREALDSWDGFSSYGEDKEAFPVPIGRDLSQYECDVCRDQHYHTRRRVNLIKDQKLN